MRPHAAWLIALVAASPALAGCLAGEADLSVEVEPSGVPEQTLGDDEFWMVRVHGNETRERVFGPSGSVMVCSIIFSHRVDEATKTLTYASELYDVDPNTTRAVIAFDQFEAWGDCPLAYGIEHGGPAEVDLGRSGPHTFEVLDDGAVVLDGGRSSGWASAPS